MERIDTAVPGSRLAFWQNYISHERKNHDEYKLEWMNGRLPKNKGFLQFESRESHLKDGIVSFERSVGKHNSNNELWIAYSSKKPINKAMDITIDDVEIAVPVMTDKDSPMVTPMGIGRSFHFLLKALENKWCEESENKFKLHPGSTMDLLSLIAKVMKLRDEKKIYVIHAPVPKVREFQVKALPDHVYVGDNVGDNKNLAWTTHEAMKENLPSKAIYNQYKELDDELTEEYKQFKREYDKLFALRNDTNREEIKAKHFEMEARYEEQQEEKRAKKNELFKLYMQEEDKERDDILQQLAAKVEMTPKSSPIRRTGKKIQIFDQTRKNVLFEHDRDAKIIFVNNQKLEGDETDRYDWFYHGDMVFNRYVTTELDALANLKQFKPLADK